MKAHKAKMQGNEGPQKPKWREMNAHEAKMKGNTSPKGKNANKSKGRRPKWKEINAQKVKMKRIKAQKMKVKGSEDPEGQTERKWKPKRSRSRNERKLKSKSKSESKWMPPKRDDSNASAKSPGHWLRCRTVYFQRHHLCLLAARFAQGKARRKERKTHKCNMKGIAGLKNKNEKKWGPKK